ncbi:MAG TPA: hypothetical protein H9783_04305 [Candidatus Limosilactobacillus faecipullorum]|nr:hypothetical protein [Candidatus Limosilactobacillus faecipullorum]
MLDNVTVDQSFFDTFPGAQVNILFADGIDNHNAKLSEAERRKMLNQAMDQAADEFLGEAQFAKNPVVAEWRTAYQAFKKKKGARSSIEALLKRVDKETGISTIDPLVDLYNSISIANGVPIGIEDRDKIQESLRLGVVHEGLAFQPVGADKDEPTLEGEIAWYDNDGAVCRCLNWRDAQRTMLDENSQNIVAVIESVNPAQSERANIAMNRLAELIEENFGVKPLKNVILTADTPTVNVAD